MIFPHKHRKPLNILGTPGRFPLEEVVDFSLGGGAKGNGGEVGKLGLLEGGPEGGDGGFYGKNINKASEVKDQ